MGAQKRVPKEHCQFLKNFWKLMKTLLQLRNLAFLFFTNIFRLKYFHLFILFSLFCSKYLIFFLIFFNEGQVRIISKKNYSVMMQNAFLG